MIVSEILEIIMLICFGVSWPLSVAKNIKAKTAKNMSLPFILLILFGYAAGIASKFISGNVGYVLIVYFLNVLSVGLNLVIYFINFGYDKKRAKSNSFVKVKNEKDKVYERL